MPTEAIVKYQFRSWTLKIRRMFHESFSINGSPHMDDWNTALILHPFLDGMREAGADVELFYTRKLKTWPCNGDMSCWFKNPGKCGQDDDMQMLLPKIKDADVIVWATPVYYAGITGPLKNLMDRQLPLHMAGELNAKKQKIVLVSSCGFWDESMFDPLIVQMKALYARPDGSSEFVGALLRPGADAMREILKGSLVESVFKAAKDAGQRLVKEGKISEDLLGKVSKKLMSDEEYQKGMKKMMEQMKKATAQ
jgi:multimeric flavodoxin WrbA